MQKQDFPSLLNRYLAGQASAEEEALLAQFFEQSGDARKDTHLSQPDEDRLFLHFSQSPRFRAPEVVMRSKTAWLRSWYTAAACLLAITSSLTWFLLRNTSKPVVYKEIRTGRGQLLTVLLPDSSEIILNANSTLRYHPSFARNREVQLSGEALFRVHGDPAHPFRINTGDSLLTEVLGTEFNINNYSNTTRVTVLSGRVRVQRGTTALGELSQHQALAYDHQTHSSTGIISAANAAASWTKGEWIYDGMTLADLQSLLNNYYGITLRTTGEKNYTTSASLNFHKRQNAREIVTIFCAVAGCQYKWTDTTTVTLY